MKVADIKVDLIGHYGGDIEVVNAARVSMEKESEYEFSWEWQGKDDGWVRDYAEGGTRDGEPYWSRLKPSDAKLIGYLAKHEHTSPFNHAFLSFRVKAPIFVARQLVKHKFLPWNEVSRRYVSSEPEFYIPDMRKCADNVKQGSSNEIVVGYIENESWGGDINIDFSMVIEEALAFYNCMVDNNVAPEVARAILPQNTMTEWIWSGTLGAFLDMLKLRLDPHTQKESRDVAKLVAEHVKTLFPESYKARLT